MRIQTLPKVICIALFLCFTLIAKSQKVSGFFPDWVAASKLNDVQYSKLTDVFFAFVYPDGTGNLQTTTANSASNILAPLVTNVHNAGGKAHICAGGANSSGNFSTVVASSTFRANFVNSMSNFIQTYDLDGINVDWEFPTGSDAANLALLLQEIRTKLDELEVTMSKPLELSIAVAPLLWNNDGINSTSISVSDYIYVMAFDAQGACCVCGGEHHSTLTVAEQSLQKWTTGISPSPSCGDGSGKNAPASKLVLSIPFYSTEPYTAYNTFSASDPNLYFNDADGLVGSYDYNSCPIIQQKADMVMNTFGGAGIWTWELSQDRTDQYSLTSCMYDAMQSHLCNTPTPSLGADQSICGVGSIILNSNVTTATGRTFTWKKDGVAQVSNSSTATTYTASSTGTYVCEVTQNSCANSDEVIITGVIPSINLGGPYDLCNPSTYILDAGIDPTGLTFEWKNNGTLISNATSATYTASAAGVYTVTASAAGCNSQTDNATVTSSLPIVNHDTICSPGTVNPSASTSVEWYSASTGGSLLFTGTSYSPSISSNTTYYVQESGGSTQTVTTMRSAFQNDGWQQDANVYATKFTALQDLTIDEVQVNAGGGSVKINIVGSDGTTIVATKTFSSVSGVTTLTLNFSLSAGTYYINTVGSVSTLLVDLTPASNYSETGIITIEGEAYWDWSSPYGDGYVISGDYGFFTNLKITTGGSCERIPVYSIIDANHNSCNNTPPVAGFTANNTTACVGETIVFTDASTGGAADSYSWNFGLNASPSTANTAGPHSVTYSTEGNKSVSLTVTNSFGNSTETKTDYISITNMPGNAGSITGSNSVCTGTTSSYSIASVTGANNYTWTIPTGAIINSGQGTTNIEIDFSGASSGNITVTPSNGCGNGGNTALAITINPLPDDPGSITGNSTVCSGTTNENFSITAIGNASGYNWTLPTGATITSGNGSNSVMIDFTGASSGNLTVIPSNSCGNGNSSTKVITINNAPSGGGNIIGQTNICPNESNIAYSVSPVTDATNYSWTVPNGAIINSGQGSQDVNISFGSTAGILKVLPSNSCGDGTEITTTINATGSSLPIIEDFESGVPPSSWTIKNTDQATTWEQANSGGNGTSNNSAYINFRNYSTQGQKDELVSTNIDFSGTANHTLTFNHAYAWYDRGGTKNDKFDSLVVLISTDCGSSFSEIWRKGGAELTTTGGGQQGAFTPTNAQWVNNSIDLSAYDGQSTVIIMFRGINDNGNNLYIDDINITGVVLSAPTADFSADKLSVCTNTSVTYTDASTNSPTSWTWDFGIGASPATATGQGPHLVTYLTSGSKTVILTSSNSAGNSVKTRTSYITVDTLPETTGNLSGVSSACKSSPESYSILSVTGATGYSWSVPSGSLITSGDGTSSITVDFSNSASGNITLTPTNGCGDGSISTIAVQVKDKPSDATSIIGSSSACENETGVEYNISQAAGATSYNWTLPTGAIIAGKSDTNVVLVDFSTNSGNITVTPSNSCGNGNSSTLAVSITNGSSDAGAISGTASVCENQAGVNYSITAVTGASGYIWTIPAGAAIASGDNTNSISVNFGSTSGDVTVTPISSCGNGANSTFSVIVNPLPNAAGNITGTTTVCNGDSKTYTIASVNNATSYNWTLPTGANITNGLGTNSITIDFSGASSGDVTVTPVNSCGNGSISTISVTVNDVPNTPGNISGVTTVCENETSVSFSVASVANTDSYTWSVPSGSTIANGQGSENVTVNFGTTSGNIFVKASNACGTSLDSSILVISITNGASAAGNITGTNSVCENTKNESYSISSVNGATAYNWTVPTGATIINGQGTNGISVDFGSVSGNITVTPTSTCGNGTSNTTPIIVNPYPTTPTNIIGDLTVCMGDNKTYSITNISNATSYTWTVPIGAVITSGANTNSITVDFSNATSGNITVKATNGSCVGGTFTELITVNDIPQNPGIISGNSTICSPSNSENYSITPINNTDSYTWNFSGSGVIISGTSNSITSDFATNATSGNLYVKANNTCGSSDSVILSLNVNPTPSKPSINGPSILPCDAIEAFSVIDNGGTYDWLASTALITGNNNANVTIDFFGITGNINVICKELNNGCTSSPDTLTIDICNIITNTEAKLWSEISIHPNPSIETFNIHSSFSGKLFIRVFDGTGKLVSSNSFIQNLSFGNNLTPGTYWIELNNGYDTKNFKVIKIK